MREYEMNILEEIQNCPVEWKELGEVVDYEQPTKYIVSSKAYAESNEIPVLTAGQSFILGYTNEKDGIYQASKNNPVIIFDDFTTSKQWVDFKFKVKSSAMKMLTIKDEFENEVLLRYAWHYLGTIIYKPDQHGRQWIGTYSKFLIPIPPLEIQEKIVQILDKFTAYVTELTSELTSRKKQYSFYRDKLLSFEDEFYKVEWKTILDISKKITSGGTPNRSNSLYYGGSIPWLRTQEVDFQEIYDTELSITEEGLANSSAKWIEKNAVIVAMYGATAAKVGIAKIPLTTNQACCNIEVDEDIANYRYVYHWLTYNYETLKSMGQGSQSNINAGIIKSFKIPVPSLEIQSRIVQVLDNFDTVCNDLNIGLPKEIELRQKQYEYFREKLLTFTAEGVYPDSGQWTVAWAQSDLIKILNWVFGPIRVELGQIFNTKNGYTPTKTNLDNWRNGTIPWFRMEDIRENGGILSDSIQHITEGAVKGELFPANSIIIATSATIGYHALVTRKFLANQRFTCLLAKEGISGLFIPNFLYYYCFELDEFCRQNTLQGNFATVDMTKFKKFKFIIPSIKRQREIISILDNFNTLTNSLSEGLPKEIELRQKQYEYWREQLLKFTR